MLTKKQKKRRKAKKAAAETAVIDGAGAVPIAAALMDTDEDANRDRGGNDALAKLGGLFVDIGDTLGTGPGPVGFFFWVTIVGGSLSIWLSPLWAIIWAIVIVAVVIVALLVAFGMNE